MDGACKKSGKDLQIGKHSLGQHKKGTVSIYTHIYICVCMLDDMSLLFLFDLV